MTSQPFRLQTPGVSSIHLRRRRQKNEKNKTGIRIREHFRRDLTMAKEM